MIFSESSKGYIHKRSDGIFKFTFIQFMASLYAHYSIASSTCYYFHGIHSMDGIYECRRFEHHI